MVFIPLSDFRQLADGLCEYLGDKEWAKKHYKNALEILEKTGDADDIKELKEKLKELG